jgi:hypothetical protein
MRRLISLLVLVAAGFSLLVACRKESDTTVRKLGFDAFVPQYNSYIHKWLLEQQASTKQETARITAALATAEGEARALLEIQAEANRKDLEKWDFRLGLGDFLKFGNPSESPPTSSGRTAWTSRKWAIRMRKKAASCAATSSTSRQRSGLSVRMPITVSARNFMT